MGVRRMKVYEVWIEIEKNSKVIKWGYCISAVTEQDAAIEALNRAVTKVEAKYSRLKGADVRFHAIREAFSKDVLHTLEGESIE
jgi:hypothetical protein